jgi:hypothetical protein
MEIVAIAVVISTMVSTWASFLVSLAYKDFVVWPAIITFVISSLILYKIIKYRTPDTGHRMFIFTLVAWSIYLIKLFSQMLVVKPDGIWAGGSNVWGDWAGHIGYISNWLHGANWPPQNPWYAGIRLAYPFLFDYTSAILAKLGLSLSWSLQLPGIVFGIILIVLLFKLSQRLTKSAVVGAISVAIFMLSGGLGFYYINSKNLEATHNYEANIQLVNFVISEMVPQRGILLGLTAALAIFILLDQGYFLLAGVTAGMIPFFHAHTYLVVMAVSGVYFLYKPKRQWFWFFVPSIVLALPQYLYFSIQTSNFIKLNLGWAAHVQKDNWLWFWFKNIGLLLLLIPTALILALKKDKKIFFLYLPFLIIFIACNIWIFQPWENDNTKFLRYWYLASSILAGWFLVRIPKPIAMLILASLLISGSIDASSWLNFEKNKLQMWSQADMTSAETIKTQTPKDSIFLTKDNHNHWVVDLAGRKIVMGFRGWLWSWGINYSEREKDVVDMFMGDTSKFSKYNISYVILEPDQPDYYSGRYPSFRVANGQKIFDVRSHILPTAKFGN